MVVVEGESSIKIFRIVGSAMRLGSIFRVSATPFAKRAYSPGIALPAVLIVVEVTSPAADTVAPAALIGALAKSSKPHPLSAMQQSAENRIVWRRFILD